jgi:hypothetical protein
MSKRLLETSLGHWDDTWFSKKGLRVSDDEALKLIKNECNSYNTKDNGGVIVYFSEEEYEKLKEDPNYKSNLEE